MFCIKFKYCEVFLAVLLKSKFMGNIATIYLKILLGDSVRVEKAVIKSRFTILLMDCTWQKLSRLFIHPDSFYSMTVPL